MIRKSNKQTGAVGAVVAVPVVPETIGEDAVVGSVEVIEVAVDADGPDHETITVTARVPHGTRDIDAANLALQQVVARIKLGQGQRGFIPISEIVTIVVRTEYLRPH